MSQFLINALSTTAVSTALIVVLAWLFRSWIGERLKNAIKHEYDREIESYKTILSHVHAATAAGQQAAIEARIRAFDRLWKAVLAIRNNTGMITTFLDVLTVEEYAGIKEHEDFQRMVGDLDHNRIEKMVPDSGIEEVRPYVGEIVWALFFAYQAVNVRIVLLAWMSKTDDEKYTGTTTPLREGCSRQY